VRSGWQSVLRPLGLAIMVGLLLATASDAATPNVAGLSAAYLDAVLISVPEGIPAVDASSAAKAVATAQAILHRTEEPTSIFAGRAARYVNDPAVDVIVVVFAGGRLGPLGRVSADGTVAAQPTLEFSGVIIARDTGEVLRWFRIGHM
jgi:hypothetical protein